MYTVDRIEKNIVILENRNNNKMIEINIDKLPKNIKEGDIITLSNNEYVKEVEKTKLIKNNIRNRFNRLKNK